MGPCFKSLAKYLIPWADTKDKCECSYSLFISTLFVFDEFRDQCVERGIKRILFLKTLCAVTSLK